MQNFFEEVIVRLARAKVEFVIVGGVSAVLHGVPIATLDIDICYRRTPENQQRLASALAPLHPRLRDLPPDVPNVFDERSLRMGTNFTLVIGNDSIDLLGEMSAIGTYEQVVQEAPEMDVAGHRVKVLSLEALIKNKRAVGRPKDLLALLHIEATWRMKQQASEEGQKPL